MSLLNVPQYRAYRTDEVDDYDCSEEYIHTLDCQDRELQDEGSDRQEESYLDLSQSRTDIGGLLN